MVLVVATAICMTLAFQTVEIGQVGTALSALRPHYAALALFLILCNLLIAMARFRVLLGRFGFSPAWRRLFAAFSVGLLGNQFVFNVIGQSVGRAGVLSSSGVPFGATIIATLFERILAACILAVAGIAAAWFLLPRFGFGIAHGGAYFLVLVAGVTLAAVAAVAVSYRRGAATRTFSAASRSIRQFWSVLLMTIVAHAFMLGGYIAALFAMGLETVTFVTVGASLLVMFAASLPISLSGWGIRELGAVAVLGTVGVEPSMAFAAALVVGLLSLGLNLALAVPTVCIIAARRHRTEPDQGGKDHTVRWNDWLITGCAMATAVTIFFQVRIQGEVGVVTANVADIFALFGLGFFVLLMVDSRERMAAISRPFVGALIAFSILLGYGLLLGYVNFGANSWALVNRGLGWVIILGYVSVGISIALAVSNRARDLVLRVFVAAGTTVAALQLLLLLAAKLGLALPSEAFKVPLQGFANNSNAFALQMLMTGIAAVILHRLGALGRGQRWLATILFVTGLAIYFSASRAGTGLFIVLLIMSVALAPLPERRAVFAPSLLAAFAVALAAIAIISLLALGGTSNAGDFPILGALARPNASDSQRWQLFLDGWNLWLERPLIGHGLGAYVERQLAASGHYEVFHTVPIWLMAETGLIGLTVGLVSFVYLALDAHRLLRVPGCRAWGTGLLIALLCWGAANQVHDFVYQRTFWFLVAVAFGLGSIASNRTSRSVEEESAGGRASQTHDSGGTVVRRLSWVRAPR